MDLFDVENLWRKHAYEIIEIGEGYKAHKLSEDYEVVREGAYSLFKDFNLSIPGFYLAINTFINRKIESIEKIAEEENLLLPFYLYLDIAHSMAYNLFGSEDNLQLRYKEEGTSNLLLKLVKADFSKRLEIPYSYPIYIIAWVYFSKLWLEIHRDRNLKVILQIIKQPSSKGIGILLDFIREHFR